MRKRSRRLGAIVLVALIVFSIGFFGTSTVPYGYDPGMYREIHNVYLQFMTGHLSLADWPKWLRQEPLWGILSVILGWLGRSIDLQLGRGIGIASCLPVVGLVWYLQRKVGRGRAILGGILYMLSIVRWEATVMLYYKQLLCLSLGLILMTTYEQTSTQKNNQKSLIWSGILIALMLALHRHTSLFFALFLGLDFLLHKKIDKRMLRVAIGAGVIGAATYVPRLLASGFTYLHEVTSLASQGYQGIFFTTLQFSWFEGLLLIGGLCYSVRAIWRKKWAPVLYGCLIGALWIFTGFLNAYREQILLDPLLVLGTILALAELARHAPKTSSTLTAILFLLQGSYFGGFMTETAPLISPLMFADIKAIHSLINSWDVVMTDDSRFTPWIMGYTGHPWISPGLSDLNHRDHEQRNTRRSVDGVKKCQLLETYSGEDLVFWAPNAIAPGPCFDLIKREDNSYLYRINLKEK